MSRLRQIISGIGIIFFSVMTNIMANGQGIHGYIRTTDGKPIRYVNIDVFDGFHIDRVVSDERGEYYIPFSPLAEGLYIVLFYHKAGYIPVIRPVKVDMQKMGEEIYIRLRQSKDPDRGFLAGVVYQPIRGGKLHSRKGIYGFVKNQTIGIYDKRKGNMLTLTSDRSGRIFMDLLPGDYIMRAGNQEKTFTILPKKTTIQNLRLGIALID